MALEDFRTRFPRVPDIIQFARDRLRQQELETEQLGRDWSPIVLGDPGSPLRRVTVQAYVNAADLGGGSRWQGRWIARCADPTCSGAEYVDFQNLVFMCCGCWNEANGHQWLTVSAPIADVRDQIDVVLSKRPGTNRHWKPTETVEQLRAENLAHGLEG